MKSILRLPLSLIFILILPAMEAIENVEHKYAENQNVKIHYVSAGEGPLIVFIHGFPDFWYSWRHQMEGLKDDYQVVALDTRGYNKSDQPTDQKDYDISFLVADVEAVIRAEGQERAIIVGHDWGGMIAWNFAISRSQMTEKLIIVNLPHPRGFTRELATNPDQYKNSQYARNFQKQDSHLTLNPKALARFAGKDDMSRAKYEEALGRSSLNGMMNYYRQNYPKEPYTEIGNQIPSISVPVLQFHGLKDTALHHHGLNNTWEWTDKDYTLVTIPEAAHWAHHDASDLVTDTIKWWLAMRP